MNNIREVNNLQDSLLRCINNDKSLEELSKCRTLILETVNTLRIHKNKDLYFNNTPHTPWFAKKYRDKTGIYY